MSKGAGKQTTTTAPDPATQAYQQKVYQAAQTAASQPYQQYNGQQVAPVNGLSNQGTQGVMQAGNLLNGLAFQNLGLGAQYSGQSLYGQTPQGPGGPNLDPYQHAGATGAAALGGDPTAISRLMNPYTQNVVDQVKGQYGDLNDLAQRGINDQFSKAGAFGGSRQGVASGVASGQIAKGLGQQIAGLEQSGYQDAMNQANQAAGVGLNAGQLGLGYGNLGLGYQQLGLNRQLGLGNLGLGYLGQAQSAAQGSAAANGQLFGMGDYNRQVQQQGLDVNHQNFIDQRDWGLRNLDVLKGGLSGVPYGQTTSQPLSRNVGAGVLGGAATGAQIGSVIPGLGTALGAGIGGILGLF